MIFTSIELVILKIIKKGNLEDHNLQGFLSITFFTRIKIKVNQSYYLMGLIQ